MMLTILFLVMILSFWGTIKNRRLGNKFGVVVGGLFSVTLAGVTVLASLITFGIVQM
ncbi:hypothetical protein [Numidum massiliense]|uniref:hypothetical protein n=1 Tax=Numidum massiliense TaxID=1522315 RepID=UPI0012F95941|nr:hypothetical protein [Numidum massiliense]